MGTRAIITINEKPFIATHWDGDPPCLGKKLWYTKTETEIRAVANEHTIDFACPRVIKTEQKRRYARIASKTNGKFTAKDIEKLDKQGKIEIVPCNTIRVCPINDNACQVCVFQDFLWIYTLGNFCPYRL